VDNGALTPGSMFGYVIMHHTVMMCDQSPLAFHNGAQGNIETEEAHLQLVPIFSYHSSYFLLFSAIPIFQLVLIFRFSLFSVPISVIFWLM